MTHLCLIALLVLSVNGCCALCKVTIPAEGTSLPPRAQCLRNPPPEDLALNVVLPAESGEVAMGGCPAQFAGCFLPEDAIKLTHNVAAHRRWERDAWILCGGGK